MIFRLGAVTDNGLNLASDALFKLLNKIDAAKVMGFTVLGHDIDHIQNVGSGFFNRIFDARDHNIGKYAGKQVTRADNEVIRIHDGINHRRMGLYMAVMMGHQINILDFRGLPAAGDIDGAFAEYPRTVG